jgi:4-amino-4-deoxy-L-arabinose transferase-like glycosyltransferase
VPRARALIRFWGVVPVVIAIGLFAIRGCVHVDPRARLTAVGSDAGDPPNTHAQVGSLAVTRGGPVIVGFVSATVARLTVGGHELRGLGVMRERYIVPAGPLAIRFAAPPGARLIWSPVGRRGDPEYIPASSLSPDHPDHATFDAPGASPCDGIIALGLLVTLVGSLVMLARRRLATVPRATWIAMGAVFVAAVVVRWIDLGGFGQTWDEDVNWAAGRNYVTNLLGLDFSDAAWRWNYEHPPVMKLLDGIGAQLADGFGPARAMSAVWISLGCALLVPIGTRLYSRRVGILAAVIAALLPPLVAHGQIVGHESPTVLWWSLGVLLALGVHDGLPDDHTRLRRLQIRLAWVGVVIGVAVASRFVNGLLGVLCLLIVIVQAPRPWRRRAELWGAVIMPIAAVLAFYVLWPRLWTHPVRALGESLAKLDTTHSPEPFLGMVTAHPGARYFLVYLFATLPIGVLAGVIAWTVRAARERTPTSLLVLAWFVIPLGVAASPVRQDGLRYVMPCLPVFALMAAAGFDFVATKLEHRVKPAFVGLAAAITLYLAITLVRVHPYYLDYFGEQVGGAGTVARHRWFETAWWGEGVASAVDYVNEHAAPNARVFRDCIEPGHLAWFREDLWAPMVRDPKDADWIVSYSPAIHACPVRANMHEVFAVTVDGVVLAAVYQRQ